MSARYDVIVLGLGGMGSAVAAHAAARGMRVLGLEQFGPAHARGSSHGETRIIRQAYFESPEYVPLLRRAYELWDALAARTGATLRVQTGGLFVGRPDAPVVAGTLGSARQWELAHAVYDASELRARFPAVTPRDDEIGVYEAIAGAVFPEAGVRAHLDDAAERGAQLRFGVRVAGWDGPDGGAGVAGRDVGGNAVRVTLDDGTVLEASRLAICAGAWFAKVAPELGVPLRVERNVQFFFAPLDREAVSPERLPVYGVERDGGRMFYGFPDLGGGVKAAYHGSGVPADPDALDRVVRDDEIAVARDALASIVPAAAGPFLRAAPCMYTLTPDEHFVIGAHPRDARVVVAGGFSGHGYKFTPVVGEIVAALLAGDDPEFTLGLFAPERFAAGPSSAPRR
ncbi:MAG TPA: N-methyl-L-tryptophan oxidase [Candidatus Elarobacter sp.]|jgi:monomeric sarcosine oxidase|nr:N-methyl-L-tryptophan oxidase [Candidatus Elarobacter sp.]